MAQIKPFEGLRFSKKAGDISSLACPPYDIIDNSEREVLLEKNPYNIVRLELPAGENRYDHAAKVLQQWLAEGILCPDSGDCYYVYEQQFAHAGKKCSLKGLISRVRLEEFEKGIILPHEDTLSKAKEDRFRLMKATGCNFSQVYSLYNDPAHEAAAILEEITLGIPTSVLTDAGQVCHKLWQVPQSERTQELEKMFEDKKLYIADGHHRYETAIRYRDYLMQTGVNTDDSHPSNYIMMMLTDLDNSGLVVLPTHRIVHSLKNFDLNSVLKKAKSSFEIEEFDKQSEAQIKMDLAGAENNSFILYKDSRFILLTLKDSKIMKRLFPSASDAYRNLDVAVIHALFLESLLNIDKDRLSNQENISYTRSADEAIAKTDAGEADFCLLLAPTKVSEIKDVALAGEKMPQKSTYFYPKLITGLVINKII